jgi:hypothetical protein
MPSGDAAILPASAGGHVIELVEDAMVNRQGSDSGRYVQPRPEGYWKAVTERHERTSGAARPKAEAINRAREIATNVGRGEVRIKNRDHRFVDSDAQGGRHESPARDRR